MIMPTPSTLGGRCVEVVCRSDKCWIESNRKFRHFSQEGSQLIDVLFGVVPIQSALCCVLLLELLARKCYEIALTVCFSVTFTPLMTLRQ